MIPAPGYNQEDLEFQVIRASLCSMRQCFRIKASSGYRSGEGWETGVGSGVTALSLKVPPYTRLWALCRCFPWKPRCLVCSTVILSFWAQSVDLESECGEPEEQGRRAHVQLGWNKTEACLSTFPRGVERWPSQYNARESELDLQPLCMNPVIQALERHSKDDWSPGLTDSCDQV